MCHFLKINNGSDPVNHMKLDEVIVFGCMFKGTVVHNLEESFIQST